MVAAGKVSRSGLQTDGSVAYWCESRPKDGGRQVVVAAAPGAEPVDVSSEGVSVRTRVHEYGGGAMIVADGVLYYSDGEDGRLRRMALHSDAPIVLTPSAAAGESLRFADFRLAPSGQWLVAVEELIAEGVTTHRLVAVATDGSELMVALASGTDFVAAPRISRDGSRLAWMGWDHPAMPWDSSEVRVAALVEDGTGISLRDERRVGGGPGIAVGQPRWCRDGGLLFICDRGGWWLPVRVGPEGFARAAEGGEPAVVGMVEVGAEFHAPDWALGQSTMAELPDGSLVARMHRRGRDELVHLRPPVEQPRANGTAWSITVIDQPCVSISGVAVGAGSAGSAGEPPSIWVLGSTPWAAQVVFELPNAGTPVQRSTSTGAESPASVARAELFVARGRGGEVPGLFFAPASEVAVLPDGELPPLVVFCHGGPTGAAEPGFDPVVQFFTSRGLAVAAVDYRGSTGYGRQFRLRLDRSWGEADIDDCVSYAEGLADAGLVDGARMAIRGTSAGGLTALGALVRSDRFRGAASWYGVTDLEALARDTHDFESRYLDTLVGPWPEAAALYRERSPIHHPERVSGQVLLLQGAEDPVVPADQAERFAAELADHGRPCRLVVFPGEAHGFRRAETIEACLEAELDFYRELFSA